MKKVTKTITELFDDITEIIQDRNSIPYLEQIRVKEFSDHIPSLEGQKTVMIPFSGGLDSTSSLLMALESSSKVQTVFLDYGQSYSIKERKAIAQILMKITESEFGDQMISHTDIDISWLVEKMSGLFPGEWAHIFPMRNFIILRIAADIIKGDLKEIWFSPVQGEVPYSGGDKSEVFINYMRKYLMEEFSTALVLPVRNLTKGDLVNWTKADSFRSDVISSSISCFSPDGSDHCSKCQACFNRAVAFYMNDAMDLSGIDLQSAQFSEFIHSYKKKLKENDYYSKRRRKELAKFISDHENGN